jgi:hypothetical protein
MVTEADFRPRKAPDTVSFGLGNGGARANPDSYFGLAAPLHVPHGATVTSVRVFYDSDDPGVDVRVSVTVRSSAAGYYTWGESRSGGTPPAGGYVDLASRLAVPFLVENDKWEWVLMVSTSKSDGSPKSWGDKLVVHRAVVSYILPEVATPTTTPP